MRRGASRGYSPSSTPQICHRPCPHHMYHGFSGRRTLLECATVSKGHTKPHPHIGRATIPSCMLLYCGKPAWMATHCAVTVFEGASIFNDDLSSWNVAGVKDMSFSE